MSIPSIPGSETDQIENVRSRLGALLDSTPADGPSVVIPPDVAANLSGARLASYIDHTLLKPEATAPAIERLCQEALEFRMAAVCVNPIHVARCVERLGASDVIVATVVGFPMGAVTPETKAFEAAQLSGMGAGELDMVMNIGALKDNDYALVKTDIERVVKAPGQSQSKGDHRIRRAE